MEKLLPSYLEASMENFTANQDKMLDYFSAKSAFSPFAQFE
jgi:polyhydroxyalkanoate synthesis regulator protein